MNRRAFFGMIAACFVPAKRPAPSWTTIATEIQVTSARIMARQSGFIANMAAIKAAAEAHYRAIDQQNDRLRKEMGR